jgi:hypothetical protein
VLAQTYGGAVVNTGWDFQLNRLGPTLGTFAPAHATGFFGLFALALALWAHHRLLYVAKHRSHRLHNLPVALAGVARFELVARLCRRALAVRTGVFEVES